jgi:hypothetical protein
MSTATRQTSRSKLEPLRFAHPFFTPTPFAGKKLEVPFVVTGIGGINDQPVPNATGQISGDHSFDASHQGFGYLLVEATATNVEVRAIDVGGTQKAEVDHVRVNF